MPFTAVCLGSVGAGKTRLLNLLTRSNDDKEEEGETEPLPTVGINHFDVKEEKQQEYPKCFSLFCRKRRVVDPNLPHLTIREFGGALQAAWLTYLQGAVSNDLKGFIYVVDASTSYRFSEAGVHLVDVIDKLERIQSHIRVLIVFSKVDLVDKSCKSRLLTEAKTLLRLDHLSKWCNYCTFDQVEYSALDESGLEFILNWCHDLYT